ncbi:uncharacterized protein LOC130505438 [Raphanus sativus]|uniref:Uncharacterized protein LOC130505438 n=1 Tax=Raphanus sativus TaxID=3726 RepID=A0A9W3CX64_RAPSA|nr:uncharacterized protein LOC130505438 [Raphanus sativus]
MGCGEKDENRDHLYYTCPYTFTVWMTVAERLLGAAITPDWDDTVVSLLSTTRSRLDTVILRPVFHTSIYVIWKESNSRRHGGACAFVEATSKGIGKVVKNDISSLKYKGNHKLEGLLQRWFAVNSN